MANKLTTQGYFIKRLRDSGYVVNRVFSDYGEVDPRQWTVVIDPGVASVFCTCYIENDDGEESGYWELYDGGQYIPTRLKIKTESVEVVLNWLNRFNITNKSEKYTSA